MPEDLRILLFVVKVDWLKTFRAGDWFVYEFVFTVAVGLTDWYFIHHATYFLFCVSDSVKANIKDHSSVWEFVAFLTNFEKLVRLIELISGKKRLEDDASFGIGAEGWCEMSAGDVIYFFDDNSWCAKRELKFELDEFPLMWSWLYFGIFFKESFFVTHNRYIDWFIIWIWGKWSWMRIV